MARQSRLPPFLLTRPEAQGARFAEALRQRFGEGIKIIASPLLAPRFLTPQITGGPFNALIFTSETGVQAYGRLSADPALAGVTRCWCVGDRTAEAARALGLWARSAQGDAAALARAILAERQPGPLLHLRGAEVRGDLAKLLISAGTETISVIVYSQEPRPLTAEATVVLQGFGPVIVPLFSPRTAQLLKVQLRQLSAKAPLWIAALSPSVAEAFAPDGAALLAVASRPDALGMLEALESLIAAAGDA
ncbi:MAG: uroporphyrinogen-III synthase [Paracoccaceae bacterium]|nr:uroporphyrinogen-III synthase [Paracoccaceae bacterium]